MIDTLAIHNNCVFYVIEKSKNKSYEYGMMLRYFLPDRLREMQYNFRSELGHMIKGLNLQLRCTINEIWN